MEPVPPPSGKTPQPARIWDGFGPEPGASPRSPEPAPPPRTPPPAAPAAPTPPILELAPAPAPLPSLPFAPPPPASSAPPAATSATASSPSAPGAPPGAAASAQVAAASGAQLGMLLGKPVTLVRLACFFYGVVALFAVGYALFSGHGGTLLGDGPPKFQHLLAGAAVGCLIVAASRVGVNVWKPFSQAAEAASGLLGPIAWKDAVLLALLSGVAEELLFRGALWHLGLIGTSLLFGLVHLIPRRALWIYPLFALACGLLLGLLRHSTDSVLAPMTAHAVVNGLNLVWLGRHARQAAAASAAATPAPVAPAAGA